MRNIYFYILLFYLYCIIGYIAEVIFVYIGEKKWINRGYLMGPYLPIYGVGAMLITFLLTGYYNDPFVVFIFSFIICSSVEYATSVILEKIFKRRWWDYSWRKYHVNGRVCLFNSIFFGFGGLVIIYIANPILYAFLDSISLKHQMIATLILTLVIIVDLIISSIDAYRVSNVAGHLEVILNEYTKNKNIKINKIRTRLFDAFPYIAKNKRTVKRLKSLKKDFSKRKKL